MSNIFINKYFMVTSLTHHKQETKLAWALQWGLQHLMAAQNSLLELFLNPHPRLQEWLTLLGDKPTIRPAWGTFNKLNSAKAVHDTKA